MNVSRENFAIIASLDLDPIKVKLMHKESGEGWSLERADTIESEYRRFLYLMKTFPNEQAAPDMDVDTFWHYHILDTLKYAQDCQAVFGYFLHHFPYVGLRGEDDMLAHERMGERMRVLYEETFGETYPGTAAPEGTAFSSRLASTAISSAGTATAFSSATATTAFSSATTATAFSSATAASAFSSGINPSGDEGQAAIRDAAVRDFFSIRPRLPIPAPS